MPESDRRLGGVPLTARRPVSRGATSAASPGRSVALFVMLAFATTWAVWVPRALARSGLIEAGWAVEIGAVWAYGPAMAAVAAAALLGLLAPAAALAADPRFCDDVSVGPTERVADDVYAFGQAVTIEGTVDGSVFALGGSIRVAGLVTGNLVLAGAGVDVPGEVRGSVRAAGLTIDLAGPIGPDLLAAGARRVDLAPSGRVGRDGLVAARGRARVAGPVARDLLAAADDLVVAAPIGGRVLADVGTLKLTDRARVGGDLRYTSASEASIAAAGSSFDHPFPTGRTGEPRATSSAGTDSTG
jgi:hypothetical protein